MLIISGCPRSGTSVQMDIHRAVFGEERILGAKFPQEKRNKKGDEQEEVPEGVSAIKKHMVGKQEVVLKAQGKEVGRDFKDMNPNGFWECSFTVRGIRHSTREQHLLDQLKIEDKDEMTICKVVSQGMLASIPDYIDKIVYMVRHPRAVAKSQERLQRGFDVMHPDGTMKNIFDDLVIHTPEMYIKVTEEAARFFLNNKDIPVHFVHFEDLMSDPKKELDDIQKFTGFGDYSKAYDVVSAKLNRSKHQDIPSKLWPDAEFVYEKFCEAVKYSRNFDRSKEMDCYREIVRYLKDPKRETNREKRHWPCFRTGQTVSEVQCNACTKNPIVRENFKKHSESMGIEWEMEPCAFECGMDLDKEKSEYLSIKESIKTNFWSN